MRPKQPTALTFQRGNGGMVSIPGAVLRKMCCYRQLRERDKEAGGMLLGRLVVDAEDIVVDEATIPRRTDVRHRFSIFRPKAGAQELVKRAWTLSDQTRNYLGEWHTHPEDDPTPSGTDLANWVQIVRESRFEQDALLFMILGRKTTRVWEMRKRTRTPLALREVAGSGLQLGKGEPQ